MIYKVEPLLSKDLPICVNYISEEYEKLTNIPPEKSRRGSLVAEALFDYKAIKVVDENDKIVAFLMYDENKPYLHIITWYIAEGYRKSKPLYLISKELIDKMDEYVYVVFQKMSNKMKLPDNICKGERIDNKAYKKWFDTLKNRWG